MLAFKLAFETGSLINSININVYYFNPVIMHKTVIVNFAHGTTDSVTNHGLDVLFGSSVNYTRGHLPYCKPHIIQSSNFMS